MVLFFLSLTYFLYLSLTMSSHIELARISPETILSISNFLSTDGNWYENSTRSQADEEQTDTEEKVDLNMESLCDDQMDSDTDQVQRNWLKHTLIVACSNLDILAIASAQKIVVFERSERNLMEVVAKVRVTDEENVYISAMTGFGVAPSPSNASSKSLCQDWTCLCIGLSNGRLLFYTERGIFLFSERCTFSSLLSLRLGPSVNPGNQELVALTSDSRLVIIEGLSLCMALRSARTHIAHGERSAEELSNMLQLNAQQLQLERVAQFNDFQLDGLARIAAFDQYTGAYFAGGRTEAVTRTQLPIYAQYVCTIGSRGAAGTASTQQQQQSEREFIAFFWHNTQANSSNLTDALMSITSKISSNLPSFGIRSFLGVGVSRKDRPPKQSLAEMPTTWVYVKSSLRDGKRMSERSFLAPYGWHLVAITDNVGRILLINTRTRRILRIWKGYRQARCAWIEASSTAQQKVVKTLFLVIFAPRRGLLEVWSVQNGPRVSAFEVGEYGRLLSIPSAQFGILHGMDQSCDFPQSACSSNAIFLSPDGSLYELKVPFHLSALDASTALVHDENLIKQFMMSQAEMDDQQLLDLFGKLRTEIGRFNFMGISLKSIDIPTNSLVNLISALAKQRSIDCEKNPTSPNTALPDPIIRKASKSSHVNFSKFVNNLSQATELYQKLDQLLKKALQPQMECNTGEEEIAAADRSPKHWQFLFPSAGTAHPNITKALDIFALVQGVESSSSNSHEAMAKFVSDHQLNLREFVLCFTSTKSPSSSTGNRLVAEEESNSKNSPDLELKFATTLFTPFLMTNTDPSSNTFFSQLLTGLALHSIPSKFTAEPLRFFLTFILNNHCNQYLNWKFTLRSYQMLKAIFGFSAENDPSKIFGLIKTVEKAIIESTNTMAALILALQMNVLQHELLRDLGVSTISRDNTESKETFLVLDEVHLELQAAIQDSDANFWVLAALHLGALSLLRMFIAQLANAKAVNGGSMSLAKLAQKGASFFREQIGFSISQNEDPSIGVQQILSSFHFETSIDQMTSPADENPNSSSSALAMLCSLFPQSMCTELLIGDCVWECASAWYRNGYRELSKLKRSVNLLEQLTIVPKMQHGLAIMIWEAFLSQTFEKLFHLMEKQLGERNFDGSSSAGHFYPIAGTDWMLRRDVLVTEADLPSYLFCVRRLLDLLATASCRIEGRRDLAYGPLAGTVHHLEDPLINEFLALPGVKNFARNSEREPATLFQLADRQKQANYHLVAHHLHLTTVMDLLVNLPLECYTKPSTLFDPIGKRAFFTAFNTHPLLPMSRVDDRTKMRRQRFVEYCKEAIERGGGKPDSERCAEVLDFLIKEWALDVTNLQIKEIARLYLHGNDKEAEVRCSQLTCNRKKLALELIPIIAARIKTLIERDGRLMDKILKNAAASESTLAFIKDVQEEHMPQGEEPTEIDSAKIRKMIVVAKTCAKEKRQKLPTEHNSSTDYYSNKCQQLFKDFDEIVSIAQWLEEANN